MNWGVGGRRIWKYGCHMKNLEVCCWEWKEEEFLSKNNRATMNRSRSIWKRYCFMLLTNGDCAFGGTVIYRRCGHFEQEEEHFVLKCKDLPSNALFINLLGCALIARLCSHHPYWEHLDLSHDLLNRLQTW